MKTVLCALYVCIIFVLLMTCNGCGEAPEPVGLPDEARFEYDPSPAVAPYFEKAAERLREATGLELVSVPGGTTIDFVPAEEIKGDCGWTPVTYHLPNIVVDVYILIAGDMPNGCNDTDTVVLHEVIHSLRRGVDIGANEHGHSETGLFDAHGGNGKLTADTLNKICEVADCGTFNPEE